MGGIDTLLAIDTHLRNPGAPQVVQPFNALHHAWHTPPDEPEWQPPTSRQNVEALLHRLPPRQCVLCGLVAAESVIDVWSQAAAANGWRPSWRLAPVVALRNLRRWFAGDFKLTDLGDSVDNLTLVINQHQTAGADTHTAWTAFGWYDNHPGETGGQRACWNSESSRCASETWALVACSFATMAGALCGGPGQTDRRSRAWRSADPPAVVAGLALAAASHVAVSPRGEEPDAQTLLRPGQLEFFRNWWARCTARLAIRDATTADLH